MEQEKGRLEFLEKFGDPLDGLDLKREIVLWYPTYFLLVRIVFVVSTLLLWASPLAVMSIRMGTSLFSFCSVSVIRPYDDRLSVRLELMNETTILLLCDMIILFTNLLNAGNADYMNGATFAANSARLED